MGGLEDEDVECLGSLVLGEAEVAWWRETSGMGVDGRRGWLPRDAGVDNAQKSK